MGSNEEYTFDGPRTMSTQLVYGLEEVLEQGEEIVRGRNMQGQLESRSLYRPRIAKTVSEPHVLSRRGD